VDRPKLRPLEAVPIRKGESVLVQLFDPTRLADKAVVVPQEMLYLLSLLDGNHSVVDIQAALMRRFGQLVFSEQIEQVISQLDEALLLDSERFRQHVRKMEEEFRSKAVREPCSAGSGYPAEPRELVAMLDALHARLGDQKERAAGQVVGIVAPHIDLERGGIAYAHAYHTLATGCEAELFVIFGTAHFARQALFILTSKDFRTPLGVVPTCRELVEKIASRCSQDLFAEELVHRNEHSVEFQVVCLQHILGGREFHILPILCGSFERQLTDKGSPRQIPQVAEFLDALTEVVAASGLRTCFIAGADLSHVGRHFGDEFDLTPGVMADVEAADRRALAFLERLDPEGFCRDICSDDNARHVCGLPAIYALFATAGAGRCDLLDYRQATDYELQRAVTFASLTLYA